MKRFGAHSNSRVVDDLPISIDFQTYKHRVVSPVKYNISMQKPNNIIQDAHAKSKHRPNIIK